VPPTSWIKDRIAPHETHFHGVRRILVKKRTRYQSAVIADTHAFGRCLVLDGELQSAQADEYIYHESLVHPALLAHPKPLAVLVLGGGEGATAREILRHRSVEMTTMVDIDGEVVKFCRKHMPSWHQGSFDSERLNLVIGDAKAFIENRRDTFDVIISDLPSPAEGGPAYNLYTLEFYRTLAKRLRPGGIFVAQSASAHPLQWEVHQVLFSTLRRMFRIVRPYQAYVPSFDVPWAFLTASNSLDPGRLSPERIDGELRKRVRGDLRFYDGTTHAGLFHVPKNLRTALHAERRILTKKKRVHLYK
jgi:spermidine synthase